MRPTQSRRQKVVNPADSVPFFVPNIRPGRPLGDGRFGETAVVRSPARHGSVWSWPDHRDGANAREIRSGETC